MTGRGAEALALAETFLGTPYRHQGSTRGIGCDCLGLVRGVWRALYGREPELPPPYRRDWALDAPGEPLIEAAERHFGPALAACARAPGDLLVFRWTAEGPATHAGILALPDEAGETFIHAYEQVAVTRSPLVPSWRRRIAGVFRFPMEPRQPWQP
ncbi:NlpC/P60 family protein [Gellertiella hungarica]|uniref:NlpC/P60 family putative phage cell wall peptidase n=1 Tax=Gellertiella hungarica TaxID=1572859 RepID=A0A7W6J6L3_9HYPH|nr:NlpC/P60 family protein [Gellertiella hungarica]MBB4065719.1 NlpC/P60 family putative phage cell wall peptidase [Gellertiella hungarica]